MATTGEMETTVVYDHAEKVYRVYSTYQPHIRKFDSDERAVCVGRDEESASYKIQAKDFNITHGFRARRAPLSDEQRQAMREQARTLFAKGT